MTARSPIAVGTRIGSYEIVAWLGAGGMGAVYRARDARLDRDVAIKVLLDAFAADAGRISRFEQEARAAGRLNHPNILSVYDVGVFDGAPFIVSELLEGESLRSLLLRGGLPTRKVIDIAHQIAEGLAAAHEKHIVHRDVKPDNLFVTQDGRVKILDFGIVKLTRPSDEANQLTGLPTETAAGTVIGTPSYMSPEQIRGEPVDHRSDIFSFGIVLYEMLAQRPAFTRETAADTMSAILKEDPAPALPANTPPALALIVSRCLEKTREMRFQSARDLAFGLQVLTDTSAVALPASAASSSRRWIPGLAAAVVVVGLLAGTWSWLRPGAPSIDTLLMNATFTPFTNFEGSELDAAISPDGQFVAFMSDRSGPFHVWLKQVGTGPFVDLTPGPENRRVPGPNRPVGFSANGSDIWVNGLADRRMGLMPLTGGAPRVFLGRAINLVWSPDGTRLVYFTADPGDPVFLADRTGGNSRQILVGRPGEHNHFPAWSQDGRWIYYAHGLQSVSEYDVWRLLSSGGTPERLTELNTNIRYLTVIDARTLLFVAPAEDRTGPWLWALDVESKATRRISTGLERYLSVAASADGRRLVASVAKSTASLWSAPILDRVTEEGDVTPYEVPAVRALAPRFGRDSLFFLSSSGPGDGLWRLQDGKVSEIWKGSDEPLLESPAVAPLGDRVAVVLRTQRKLHLTLLSADGSEHKTFAEGIDVRGTAAWSPDEKWIVTGGSDAQGPGLFKISVADGASSRLVAGAAFDPVWSPDGNLIVYLGQENAQAPLLAVRPDSTSVTLPLIRVPVGGGGRARFLPNGKGLVYMLGPDGARNFWLLDLASGTSRQLTRLSNSASMNTFDITPDSQHIVFDRLREDADIRLIDLPK